jgi:phosphohistidine phosphatase
LDRVVVSPARRAQETWDGAQSGLPAAVEVVVDARIYDNDVAALFEVVGDTPASVTTLGLVGHNPSFGELALVLDDTEGDDDARHTLRAGYGTSGVAVFDVSGPWAEVRPHSATLTVFAVPRGVQ